MRRYYKNTEQKSSVFFVLIFVNFIDIIIIIIDFIFNGNILIEI